MQKKELLEQGKLTPEQYLALRPEMLKRSAEKASGKRTKETEENDELKKIKRQAAIEAIRSHMLIWRQSVLADKRLVPEAKQIALKKIDRFERRLIVRASMKFDKLSIVKVLALAAYWIDDVATS